MVGYNQLVIFCLLCFLSLCAWRVEPTKQQPRFIEAVYRVGNLNRTIEFYQVCFGMTLLRQVDRPKQNYSYAILGYGPQDIHFILKLIYNYGVDSIDVGTGFQHFSVITPDAYQMVEVARANGGVITREAGPAGHGTLVYAFVLDPNGYAFEILQVDHTPEPLNQIKLRVLNLHRAIQFYQKGLGMKLLLEYDGPEEDLAMMGYGSGPANNSDPTQLYQTHLLEFAYDGPSNYTKGNGYSHVVISTDNVFKSAEALKLAVKALGGKIIQLPRQNNPIISFLDPEGWKTVLVEECRR